MIILKSNTTNLVSYTLTQHSLQSLVLVCSVLPKVDEIGREGDICFCKDDNSHRSVVGEGEEMKLGAEEAVKWGANSIMLEGDSK